MRRPLPPLCCPVCGDAVTLADDGAWCGQGHTLPAVTDILDFRPVLAGFDVAADRRLAEELDAMGDAPLEHMLRRYWAHHPDVAPALAERFVRGDLIGELRAQEVSDQIEMIAGRSLRPDDLVLEVGAGTAALATALARRAGHVVASDVSVAWLVLARRRIRAAGVDNVTLIASTGDRLPFPTATFDLVVAADVIEHVPDARALVAACHDVIRPGGAVWLSTPNRLSVTPEPHVRVWGVGYLPRPLGKRLVRRVRGVPYDDIHTLSVFGLRRTLAATKGRVRITSPAIAQAVRRGYPPVSRRLIGVYEVLRRVPLVRQLMLLVTPLFHAMVVKNGAGDGS